MREGVKKFQRSFYRDYWQHAHKDTPRLTLAREMATYAVTLGLAIGGLALFFPPALPLITTLAAGIMPCIFAIRLYEINKEAKKLTALDITLPGIEDPETATLKGAAADLRIFANTQQMADRLTARYKRSVMPEEIAGKLALYFNDCAEAAARIEAACKGKPIDSISLTRPRFDWDDISELPIDWRSELHTMLSGSGSTKRHAAEELAVRTAATIAAVAQTQDGIAAPLRVKPIKLKARP